MGSSAAPARATTGEGEGGVRRDGCDQGPAGEHEQDEQPREEQRTGRAVRPGQGAAGHRREGVGDPGDRLGGHDARPGDELGAAGPDHGDERRHDARDRGRRHQGRGEEVGEHPDDADRALEQDDDRRGGRLGRDRHGERRAERGEPRGEPARRRRRPRAG